MKKISLLLILLSPIFTYGQILISDSIQKAPDIVNGAYSKDHNQQKEVAYEYPEIDEKDIVWSRKIWREIDLRQKINHQFYYPAVKDAVNLDPENMSLIDVVMEALQQNARNEIANISGGGANVMSNSIPNTRRLDCFKGSLQTIPGKEFDWGVYTPQEILNIGTAEPDFSRLRKTDGSGADSLDVNQQPILIYKKVDPFDRTTVFKWRVKEEVFFDKKRSKMSTRIIGLCPVAENYTNPATGSIQEEYELFWIYYPDFRDILVKTKVSNFTKNNAQERSYLGILEKRMFGSRILQESNIMNRSIPDYMIGLDALLESERIKEEIFNIEHDMWEY